MRMEYIRVNIAVVSGYLCECFVEFCRAEDGINVYGLFTA